MSTQAQNAQVEIRKNIITLFNIDKLPPEKQEETINRIGKLIFQAVLMRILPVMEEDDLKEYEKLLDDNVDAEGLFDFFFEKVPNFLEIVAEESENFRKDAEEVLGMVEEGEGKSGE